MPPRSTNAPKLTTERHDALADLAGLEVGEELVALLALGLLEVRAAREHDVVAVLVELDDLALDLAAHVGLEVADPAEVDERGGEEAPQPDVEDEAALDHLDDRALDDAVLLLDLLDRAPRALVLGTLLGEDQAAVLVFLLEHERLELVVERDDLVRVDVVADRELARRDDAFGLEADVEQHLVAVDLDDTAGDDVAVVELDDGGVDGVGERLTRRGRRARPGRCASARRRSGASSASCVRPPRHPRHRGFAGVADVCASGAVGRLGGAASVLLPGTARRLLPAVLGDGGVDSPPSRPARDNLAP